MKTLAAALLVIATTHAAHADELHASAPRTIDFAGGIVFDGPVAPGIESLPGVALDVRRFFDGPLWVGAGITFEAGADLRDPENGSVMSLVTTGISVGVHEALWSRIEVFAGLRLDGVRADGWPMAPSGAQYGVRGGPQAALAVMIGRAWGHPMSLEARASWLTYRIDGEQASGWQAGLHVVGVLFPDRPL
jgi:hypothetical protein